MSIDGIAYMGGNKAFASRGGHSWGPGGDIFGKDEHVTTDDMLRRAHLAGWNVRLDEVQTDARSKTATYEVVRDNPFDGGLDRLGFAGERYGIRQNEEVFHDADGILDGGGLWNTAGAFNNGVVWGSIAIDKTIVVGPGVADDETDVYLMVSTSHNGTSSLVFDVTGVRVDCWNTHQMARKGSVSNMKIRHTKSIGDRVKLAREVLGLTFRYAAEFEVEANKLFEVGVTNQQFDELIQDLYPEPKKDVKGAQTKWNTKRDILLDIWHDSQREGAPKTTGAIKNTAWGAANALTEYLDWYRKPRKGDVEKLFAAQAGFDASVLREKDRIFAHVKAFAGV